MSFSHLVVLIILMITLVFPVNADLEIEGRRLFFTAAERESMEALRRKIKTEPEIAQQRAVPVPKYELRFHGLISGETHSRTFWTGVKGNRKHTFTNKIFDGVGKLTDSVIRYKIKRFSYRDGWIEDDNKIKVWQLQ